MIMAENLVLILHTTHATMRVEKILKENKIKHTLIQKPGKINPACGIAISFFREDKDKLKKLLEDDGIDYEGIYSMRGDELIKE